MDKGSIEKLGWLCEAACLLEQHAFVDRDLIDAAEWADLAFGFSDEAFRLAARS